VSLNKTVADNVARRAQHYAANGGPQPFLDQTLRYMGKWRSQLISNSLLQRDGAVVQTGLFAGMAYIESAAEGALAPRLLGTYESELHPHIERILTKKPAVIVDVGCAEGYYAVGLARLAPWATVRAFDINPAAQAACKALAKINGMEARVQVGGEVTPVGLEVLCADGAFVFCDIEGAEDDLLDPVLTPALDRCSLIVETHPGARPGVTERLIDRFARSHDVELVREVVKDVPPGHWMAEANLPDRFYATWEWRFTATPWLVMTPKV
jgi:SAM-dependent methyltransferase